MTEGQFHQLLHVSFYASLWHVKKTGNDSIVHRRCL